MKKVIFICLSVLIFCFFKNWADEAKEIPLTHFYEEEMLQSDNDKSVITTHNISVTDIKEELFGDKYNFYYDSLETDMGKRVYSEFYQSVKNFDTSFYIISNANLPEEVGSVFMNVLYDNPSFFYVDYDSISIEQTVYNSALGGKVVYKVKWNYLYSEEEVKTLISSYENMIITYLKREYSSDYELAGDVFRFISDMVKYGGRSEEGQTIVSAFSTKQAVCGGYTMASKFVFDYLGIPCIYVRGTAINQSSYGNVSISQQGSENHAWNKVRLNGKWYNYDCTWGDMEVDNYKYYNYKYLMISDEILCKTHTPWPEYANKYPKCLDKMDFYSINNLYVNLCEDSNVFLKEFVNVLNFYKNDVIHFRVENIQIFEEFLKNGYLYYYFPYIDGFKYERYSYLIDYDSNIVTIFFSNQKNW